MPLLDNFSWDKFAQLLSFKELNKPTGSGLSCLNASTMPGDAAAQEDAMSSSNCIALPAAAGTNQAEAVLADPASTHGAVQREPA
jgi:hypothetical protein